MSEYIVTVIDTTGIQPYIFGSNRLRENIGASYLVAEASKQWIRDALYNLFGRNKVHFPDPEFSPDDNPPQPDAQPYIENGELIAEVIYAGGGNAVVLFKSLDDAKSFTKCLSSKALQSAPGLSLAVAHKLFNWQSDLLNQTLDDLIKNELENKKRQRLPSVPLLGLGVTADCNSTRLVAIGTSDQFDAPEDGSYLVSREVKYKLKAVNPARDKLKDFFQQEINSEIYDFPLRFDHLGRTKDESSYIAVVHADGNGMGDRFQKHGEKFSDNREYITEMRKLSWSVNKIGIAALIAVGKAIVDSINGNCISWLDSQGKEITKIELKQENDKTYLPFRPLVYGGDDVTFVCDGRLGLTLATIFLKEFEKEAADGELLTACAGISIVKAHYPFARAYNLCESLCANAKKLVKKSEIKGSAFDWHIASSGLLGSLNEIREREYQVPDGGCKGYLVMRPLLLEGDQEEWRNWKNFQSVVTEFITGKDWQGKRNKVIALREVLRKGSDATNQFRQLYQLNHLPFGITEDLEKEGWTDSSRKDEERVCGYFDAIEAMEFYLPLSGRME